MHATAGAADLDADLAGDGGPPPGSPPPGGRQAPAADAVDSARLFTEIRSMLRYALKEGRPVPDEVISVVGAHGEATLGGAEAPAERLLRAHARMSRIVAPATPRSIDATEVDGEEAGLWDIPLLRQMMIVGFMSLLGFMFLPAAFEFMDPVGEQVVFAFAAAVGASFFGLHKAHEHVVARTFDPSYKAQYWVRFALGVTAGLILANVTKDAFGADTGPAAASSAIVTAPNVVALLGGYSADVVNRILTRMVETLETVVAGRGNQLLERERRNLAAELRTETERERLRTAARLMTLEEQLGSRLGPDDREELRRIAAELRSVGS